MFVKYSTLVTSKQAFDISVQANLSTVCRHLTSGSIGKQCASISFQDKHISRLWTSQFRKCKLAGCTCLSTGLACQQVPNTSVRV